MRDTQDTINMTDQQNMTFEVWVPLIDVILDIVSTTDYSRPVEPAKVDRYHQPLEMPDLSYLYVQKSK